MGSGIMRDRVARPALYAAPIALVVIAAIAYLGFERQGSASQSGSVQVVGSETMRPLVTACAEDFMSKNPQSDIVVKGGGSGDGIAALLHGLADIGMSSRELSRRERDYATSKGIEISLSALALDGIAIIVNRANGAPDLHVDQVRKLYVGSIRNWRELEGADVNVVAFARAAGSGTASLFGDRVLGEEPYSAAVQHLPTNEAIVAEVVTRPGAIGYTGLGALRGAGDRVKVVAIRADAQSAPVSPTPETIRSGNYSLTRTLYLGTGGHPPGIAKAFIEFCLGASGQALLQRAGYVGTKPAVQ